MIYAAQVFEIFIHFLQCTTIVNTFLYYIRTSESTSGTDTESTSESSSEDDGANARRSARKSKSFSKLSGKIKFASDISSL